jgi:hypothetical protein
MEYDNNVIYPNSQERHDLDCGNFSDDELDEVIVDTECLVSFRTLRLNNENVRRFGGLCMADETQVVDPLLFRLRTALHQLEIIRLERDVNAGLK